MLTKEYKRVIAFVPPNPMPAHIGNHTCSGWEEHGIDYFLDTELIKKGNYYSIINHEIEYKKRKIKYKYNCYKVVPNKKFMHEYREYFDDEIAAPIDKISDAYKVFNDMEIIGNN